MLNPFNDDEKWKRGQGYDSLWSWFCMDRASWVTMPRVLMHEMPDEWQAKMVELLEEWDNTWNFDDPAFPNGTRVQCTNDKNKLIQAPQWLLNYRHPDRLAINNLKYVKE